MGELSLRRELQAEPKREASTRRGAGGGGVSKEPSPAEAQRQEAPPEFKEVEEHTLAGGVPGGEWGQVQLGLAEDWDVHPKREGSMCSICP